MHLGSYHKGRGNHLDAEGPGIAAEEVPECRVVRPAAVALPSLASAVKNILPLGFDFQLKILNLHWIVQT